MSESPAINEAGDAPTTGGVSRLSVAAVISSLIFFCPFTTIIGVVLGLWALATVERTPGRKGRRFAMIAIALGGMFTVLQATTAYQFLANMRMVGSMPVNAIQQAQQGDLAAFRALFGQTGESIPEAKIVAFITELESRYGRIEGSRMPVSTLWSGRPDGDVLEYEWELYFTSGQVNAEVRIRRSDQSGSSIVLEELRVPDAARGDLVFPPEESATDGQ